MSQPLPTIVIAPGTVRPVRDQNVLADREQADLHQSRWAVLVVLFIVTGCFGLALLWRSDRFSNWEKVFWSVMVTAYTIGLFAGVIYWVQASLTDAFATNVDLTERP